MDSPTLFPCEISGYSKKISLQSPLLRVKLPELPGAYRVENHHKYFLCDLFSDSN